MGAQNESSNTGTASVGVSDSTPTAISQTEDNSFDASNPFAGLVEDENNQPSANAGSDSDKQESDTIEVVATGIGQDSDQALKNALRAAIEQAVGTMVDSETLANNNEVVNDQILSYSAGFVESHKVIGEPRTRDGLVTIKIQAQVKRTQLREN